MTRTRALPTAAALFASLLAGALSLTGCYSLDPLPGPTATAGAGSEASPSPTIVLPDCHHINPVAEAEQAAFLKSFGRERITASYGETDRTLFTEFAGDSALAALPAIVQERNCNWVIYLDSVYLSQFTAELPQSAMAPLIESLRTQDFTEHRRGIATVFTRAVPTGDMRGTMGISHTFIGDIWISLIENTTSAYEQSATDAILDANPSLAEALTVSCTEHTPVAALFEAAATIAPADGADSSVAHGGWDVDAALIGAADTFDACTPLSWALLREVGATEASPTHLVMFHYGEFIGTDSPHGVAFEPEVTRVSKYALRADYRWQRPNDPAAAGKATSTFTWDPTSRSILREGDLPPGY